jgi:hypothetical protein
LNKGMPELKSASQNIKAGEFAKSYFLKPGTLL